MRLEQSSRMPCDEPENTSGYASASTEKHPTPVGIGTTLTDVLRHAWLSPFTTKSDFARAAADAVAMAASDGFISTRVAAGFYGNRWLITPTGLRHFHVLCSWEGE